MPTFFIAVLFFIVAATPAVGQERTFEYASLNHVVFDDDDACVATYYTIGASLERGVARCNASYFRSNTCTSTGMRYAYVMSAEACEFSINARKGTAELSGKMTMIYCDIDPTSGNATCEPEAKPLSFDGNVVVGGALGRHRQNSYWINPNRTGSTSKLRGKWQEGGGFAIWQVAGEETVGLSGLAQLGNNQDEWRNFGQQ